MSKSGVAWRAARDAWAAVPIGAGIAGWLTNLIALKVIFFPTEPTVRAGPAAGLMMKRQTIAMQYAQIFTHDLLTAPKIVDAMLNGPGGTGRVG